jgi:hypothetical protein
LMFITPTPNWITAKPQVTRTISKAQVHLETNP